MVPRLTTELSGPLHDVERRILDRMPDVERWIRTVIVKADAGTYGMGIMTVHDAAEVRALNRKQRNKWRSRRWRMRLTYPIRHRGMTCRKYCLPLASDVSGKR